LLGSGSVAVTRDGSNRQTQQKELLDAVFSVRSVPRLYNEDQLPLQESRDDRRVGGWCEMVTACKDVSPGAEECPLLEDITKQCSADGD
jgi:hypothetical protein